MLHQLEIREAVDVVVVAAHDLPAAAIAVEAENHRVISDVVVPTLDEDENPR